MPVTRNADLVVAGDLMLTPSEARTLASQLLRMAETIEKEQALAEDRRKAEATRPAIDHMVVITDTGGTIEIAGRSPRTGLPIILHWNRVTKWTVRTAAYTTQVFEGPAVEGRTNPYVNHWSTLDRLKGCTVSEWRLAK